MPTEPHEELASFSTDADVDAALAEFDGDPRATIRVLLSDLATLADDREKSVSTGYVRGRRIRLVGQSDSTVQQPRRKR